MKHAIENQFGRFQGGVRSRVSTPDIPEYLLEYDRCIPGYDGSIAGMTGIYPGMNRTRLGARVRKSIHPVKHTLGSPLPRTGECAETLRKEKCPRGNAVPLVRSNAGKTGPNGDSYGRYSRYSRLNGRFMFEIRGIYARVSDPC